MNTTISISKETRSLLQDFGKKSESYDDILKRMMFERVLSEKVREYMTDDESVTLDDAKEWVKLKLQND